jgi:DNA-binding NtrC family response regulator
MDRETILYLSDQATSGDPALAALEAAGYEVASTNGSTQAIALLFLMRSVAAVVLHCRAREHASFDVVRSLRAIRPGVPIVQLGCDRIDLLPSRVDACVSTGQPLEKLASAVRRLLTARPFLVHSTQS